METVIVGRDRVLESGGREDEVENESRTLNTKLLLIIGGVVLVIGVVIAILFDSVHKISEGNVGIYLQYGALLPEISLPGIQTKAPFVSEVRQISIRPETETLEMIQTVTRDGIRNEFEGIQVLSGVRLSNLTFLIRKFGIEFKKPLLFDRIAEELRIFCANHTIDEVYNTKFLEIVNHVKGRVKISIDRLGEGGVDVLNLAIPKPIIPSDIAANYKQVKVQWTEQLVATQQQKTEQIKKETETLKAVADAERQKRVLRIEVEKSVLQREGDQKLSTIQNEILKDRELAVADAEFYSKNKAAEANSILFSDNYVKLEVARSLVNNTKFYFSGGDSSVGALLSQILGRN